MKPIDIHSHVFNLRYLPLSGIIRRYSKEKVPLWAARGVARFLLNHTSASFEDKPLLHLGVHERAPILELAGKKFQKLTIQQKAISIKHSLFDMTSSQLIKGLTQQITSADLQDEEIKRALYEFSDDKGKIQKVFHTAIGVGAQPGAAFLDLELLEFGQRELERMVEWVFSKMELLANHLRWFVFMMNSEEDIFLHLRDKDGYGVNTYVHLMMDVDHYFIEENGTEHKSYYDFTSTQISNMQKLQAKYPNLIGFVAVDPSKPNWQEIMDRAIEAGFKGIKIYPPMGYHYDVHDDMLANRIYAILEYCVERDLPLFAHCNNGGFEAYPGKRHSGYNSNPVYWARALQRFPALRLCLGHAGGGSGWFSEHSSGDVMKAEDISVSWVRDDSESQKKWNNSYAAQVLRLCALYPNVYCDASYLDEMVDEPVELANDLGNRFRKRLLDLFDNNSLFKEKIMYGSDWHMLFREAKNATYYNTYVKFFNHPDLLAHKEAFFEKNTRSYLQI